MNLHSNYLIDWLLSTVRRAALQSDALTFAEFPLEAAAAPLAIGGLEHDAPSM